MNPFMNFSNANRQSVRNQNPDLPITEIAKILGTMWRAMPEGDKAKFIY